MTYHDPDSHWYLGGFASATACIVTHPIDLVRVQIQAQLKRITVLEVMRLIIKYRGLKGFYVGLWPSILRHFTYSLTRFGIYETAKHRGLVESFRRKVAVAAGSGLIAGVLNSPLEKVNVHMRTDAARAPLERRNYKNVHDGLYRLFAEGGIRNLYSCVVASALRGMLLTVAQLSIYDQIKENLVDETLGFADNWEKFFFASLIAGGTATLISLPIDVVKTIGMNANFGEFQGSCHVAHSLYKHTGAKGFYKGVGPAFLRIVPQTIFTFLIYEEIRSQFNKPYREKYLKSIIKTAIK